MRRLYALLLFLLLLGCETRSTIVNGVPERDANEILVLLNSRGIEATKIPAPTSTMGGGGPAQSMWDISVPPNKIQESLSILNQSGLPRVKGTSLLDLFGTPGLVPSDLQDRIRYQEGLSEQLANTIRKMDGVVDANVQITFPKEEDGVAKQTLTASVYVKHRGILDSSANLLINKIKRLISSAVPGLLAENVSVIADRASRGDSTMQGDAAHGELPRGMTSIWGIEMTQNSSFRFRAIFYTFIFLLFISLILLTWTLWKMYYLIKTKGVKSFFLPHQWSPGEFIEVPVVEETEIL